MARLRQLHPRSYRTSPNIADEFESVIRYINAAELGDKTLGELLATLFDSDGEFAGPVDMRFDATAGLQFRVGTYVDPEDGWQDLADVADLRGPAGTSVGTIEGEIFHNRQDFTATAGQTVFAYAWETTEDLFVYKQGILLKPTDDYTKDQANGQITLTSGATLNDKVTVITIRTGAVTNYRRSDQTAVGAQAVFPFAHTASESLLVFKNGVLQRSGGTNDYTNDPVADTVTFTASLVDGDKVTIMTVENLALQNVTGLMLESAYTNGGGLVPYSKLAIADGDIPQAKVSGLTAALLNRGSTYVQGTEPAGVSGDTWINTSDAPATFYFHDGTQWLPADATGGIPSFAAADANKYLRVNGTGTAVEFGTLDLSSRIPLTYIGAADGVASLDADAKIPIGQLPTIFATSTLPFFQSGALANQVYDMQYIWKQKIIIDGIVRKMSAGTCTVEITVDGTVVGTSYGASNTIQQSTLGTTIEVDGTSSPKLLGIKVSSVASAADLRIGLSVTAATD